MNDKDGIPSKLIILLYYLESSNPGKETAECKRLTEANNSLEMNYR
jgi:hypothetical protein